MSRYSFMIISAPTRMRNVAIVDLHHDLQLVGICNKQVPVTGSFVDYSCRFFGLKKSHHFRLGFTFIMRLFFLNLFILQKIRPYSKPSIICQIFQRIMLYFWQKKRNELCLCIDLCCECPVDTIF